MFFYKELPFCETVPSHFGHRNIPIYQLFRTIIDTVINKILVSSDGGTRTYTISQMLTDFNDDSYHLKIVNGEQFEMVV